MNPDLAEIGQWIVQAHWTGILMICWVLGLGVVSPRAGFAAAATFFIMAWAFA
jgi:hypothetical protein